jgi:hypothetical protein
VIETPEAEPLGTPPDTAPARRVNAWIERRRNTPTGPVRHLTRSGVVAVAVLGVLLLGIVGVAFRGSWTAHRDAALAAHFDQLGADLYPFAPDGLIVIALIAAMVLRHDRSARAYALSIVGIYTLSSYLINQWHGLGWFTPDPVNGAPPTPHWPVIGLIAGQLIGAIFLGSHLLVFVLRHLFPGAGLDQGEHHSPIPENEEGEQASRTASEGAREPDLETVVALAYRLVLDLGHDVSRDRLAKASGLGPRPTGRVRRAVQAAREEAELQALEEQTEAEAKAASVPAESPELVLTEASPNGSHSRTAVPS